MIVKTCACGARYTHADWNRLPFKGRQDDDVLLTELRNCPCGSTIARGFCARCGTEAQDSDKACVGCSASLGP